MSTIPVRFYIVVFGSLIARKANLWYNMDIKSVANRGGVVYGIGE